MFSLFAISNETLVTRSKRRPNYPAVLIFSVASLFNLSQVFAGQGSANNAAPAVSTAPATPATPKPQDQSTVITEYWHGTITIQAHAGKSCAETSQGSTLPYRRVMMLALQSLPSGHSQGFAWGDMLATRLKPLEFSAASRADGPADVTVMGPVNFLGLTWLPARGPLSTGLLAKSAGLIFKKERDLLSGQWRERIEASPLGTEHCVWSEASVLLEQANPKLALQMGQESRALQESFALVDAQADLPARERWSPSVIAQLLARQEGLTSKGYGASTLLPVMTRLAEQLVLNQDANKAVPVLARTLSYLEGLLDQGPLEYAAYVTHLTPLLRMAGMLEAAERLNRQSIAVLMAQGHGRSPELARLLSGYGALLMRIKALPQALQVFEQALAIEQFVNEGKHIGVVIGLVNLSRVCEVLGAIDRSRRLAQEASELHESLGLGPLKMELRGAGVSTKT